MLVLLLALLPALPFGPAPAAGPVQSPVPAPADGADGGAALEIPLLARVAVVGASVSDGFGLGREDGRPVKLADLVDRALAAPHGPVASFASSWLFVDPIGRGERLVASALDEEPTLVLGVDFLFWFGYGAVAEESRLSLLERGLSLLERFGCPVVVGDLPDQSAALEAPIPMLRPSQVPRPETLEALNARLAEWAGELPERRIVLPLAATLERIRAGEAIELAGARIEHDEDERLLQIDRLHTTRVGSAALALLALDALARDPVLLDPAVVLWNPRAVAGLEPAATAR